eukprot:TCONS_00061868-protein
MGWSCDVCDGEEFTEQDGLFYCDACGTQSQNMRVEIEEAGFREDFGTAGPVIKTKKGGVTENSRYSRFVPGKPWVIFEAFQILLKEQVKKLIEIGVDPNIDYVVHQLWIHFLRVNKIAFHPNERETVDLRKSKHTGRSHKISKFSFLGKRKTERKLGRTLLDDEADEHESDFESDFEDDDPMDEKSDKTEENCNPDGEAAAPSVVACGQDNISQQHTTQSDGTEELEVEQAFVVTKHSGKQRVSKRGNQQKERKKPARKKRRLKKDFERKLDADLQRLTAVFENFVPPYRHDSSSENSDTGDSTDAENLDDESTLARTGKYRNKIALVNTLCLCYIGLIIVEEPLIASDLLRWVREGFLPYHNIADILPNEMKYSCYDTKSLNYFRDITSDAFARRSASVIAQLGVQLKCSVTTAKIVAANLLVDLEFPRSLLDLVSHLMDTLQFEYKFTKRNMFKSLDGCVAAFIVVAVKLVYYLDDFHEFNNIRRNWFLEEFDIQPVELSWIRWVALSFKKKISKLRNGIPLCERDLKYVDDFTLYIDFCCKDVFGSFKQRETFRRNLLKKSSFEKSYDHESCQTYFNIFNNIAKQMNPDMAEIVRQSTSFPCSVSHTGDQLLDKTEKERVLNTRSHHLNRTNSTEAENQAEYLYIKYKDTRDEKSWHQSYRYLMDVLSNRIESTLQDLQTYVDSLETLLFTVDKDFQRIGNIIYRRPFDEEESRRARADLSTPFG